MTKHAFILNFLKLYNILWKLALPFLKKNRRLRPGFSRRISADHFSKADIWIQAASAGEAYLAVEIIKTLAPAHPVTLLVTTMTIQGRDILLSRTDKKEAASRQIELAIDWFPFDIPQTMARAVSRIRPGVMVLLETEIWPALLYHLKSNHIRTFILNARLSQNSFNLYQKTRMLWKHLNPDLICATSEQDARRYGRIFEKSRIRTMNNIKFEAIGSNIRGNGPGSRAGKPLGHIFPAGMPVTILASVRQPEEHQVLFIIQEIKRQFPNQVIALFPRHMHRIKAWKKHLSGRHLPFVLRSRIQTPVTRPGIILWDVFGELKAAYTHARAVFVGGSLKPLGGQNFLEPAVLGTATITGPFNDDFAWVGRQFFDRHLVRKEKDAPSVARALVTALQSPKVRAVQARKTADYLRTRTGGTRLVCELLIRATDRDR